MTAEHKSRATEAFYGRRKGKRLRAHQAGLICRLLPRLRVDPSKPLPADGMAGLFDAPVDRFRLEIGFGGGEHLLARARQDPGTGFIGVEPFVNSMAKLLVEVDEAPLGNLRLYDDDATVLLDWLPEGSLDRIDLLYPDPWPKKRHWKRRFVSQVNLDRFARALKPGGIFCFASDIDNYVNWTLLHCRDHVDFDWPATGPEDWHAPYAGWPGTRYEAKALREGRRPAYLTFVRRG